MADLVIRGMEKPIDCHSCWMRVYCFERGIGVWGCGKGKPCPLVHLPEGHGRLGDLDALKADIDGFIECMTKAGVVVDGELLWGKLLDALDNAETIVPAEGGTEECSEN